MGLREKEIRGESDLPPMLNRDCDLRLYRRGDVPDEVFNRLEAALSFHYHKAFEGISFPFGERPGREPVGDVLGEIFAAGHRLTVRGEGTPRMNFNLRGIQRPQEGPGK